MDNCHYCNMIKPEWKRMNQILSRHYNGNIVIARVNANAVSNVNNSNNIEGYPTIRIISNGNTSDFDEQRTSKNLLKWIEEGKVNPHVYKVFSKEQASEAHHYIQDRKNIGKVLIDFD